MDWQTGGLTFFRCIFICFRGNIFIGISRVSCLVVAIGSNLIHKILEGTGGCETVIRLGIVGCNFRLAVHMLAFRAERRCEVYVLAGTNLARVAELAHAAGSNPKD